MNNFKKALTAAAATLLGLYVLWLLFIFDAFSFLDAIAEFREYLFDEHNLGVLIVTLIGTIAIGLPSVVTIALISIDKIKSLEKCEKDASECQKDISAIKEKIGKYEASFKYVNDLIDNYKYKEIELRECTADLVDKGFSNTLIANKMNKNIHKICKKTKLAKNSDIKEKLDEYQGSFEKTNKIFRKMSD